MPKKINKREALRGTSQTRSIGVSISRNENAEDNTLTFVFVSDDNGGTRFDWGTGEYYTEVLDVNGATTERLNTFFKDHIRSVDSAVGKISNPHVENGKIVGEVTFGSDAESQRVFSKYNEGILTDVSIGYEIRDYEVTKGANNEQDTVTVTNFDIFEVSAVGIGFDSGATKRESIINRSSEMNEEQLERLAQLEAMSKRNKEEIAEMANLEKMRVADEKAKLNTEREKLAAEKAEVERQKEVQAIALDFGERGSKILGENPEVTANEFRALLLKDFAGETPAVGVPATDENAERAKKIDAMVDGLAMRAGAKIENPADGADRYRHASLVSIGNELLPESERSFDPAQVAERSLVSGDFPLLLQSVGARVLVSEFSAQLGTYKAWMKEVDVPDFRTMTELTATVGGGRLSKTLENGDLKELSGAENAESWKIETFGNKFVLTRQMIINDDLGNFTNLISTFGRMAQTTANGLAYDILQRTGDYSNYKMADGKSYYDVSRKNTATDPLTSDALSAGRLAMSKHKSIDGKTPLNIVPKYLIVPPALEVTAKEILGAQSKIGADNVNVPNVNQSAYELVVDPEIKSDTAWYLLAGERTFKMGYLAGTGRSPQVKVNDSTLIRTTFEGIFDIGVMCEDYRGLYRGNI